MDLDQRTVEFPRKINSMDTSADLSWDDAKADELEDLTNIEKS